MASMPSDAWFMKPEPVPQRTAPAIASRVSLNDGKANPVFMSLLYQYGIMKRQGG